MKLIINFQVVNSLEIDLTVPLFSPIISYNNSSHIDISPNNILGGSASRSKMSSANLNSSANLMKGSASKAKMSKGRQSTAKL